jgi:TonB-dependent starch-binding outer membrane protein SusC
MKKIFDLLVCSHQTLKKLIRGIKITFLIIFVSVSTALATTSYSQKAKVTLNIENKSLGAVIDEIQRQSEFNFIFDHNQVDVTRVIDIQADNELITDVLPELFAGTNVNYVVLDRKILLSTDPLDNNLLVTNSRTELQQKRITGKVVNSLGEAIPGVTVLIKGTTAGTLTDADGNFSLSLPENAKTLVISFVGMKTQTIQLGTQSIFNVTMEDTNIGLNEVLVIGYGSVKKSDMTGAIGTLDSKALNTLVDSKVINAMQGKVAGVTIEAMGGDPGADMRIQIRGAGSLSNNAPLVLIDGVQGTMSMLNPANIKSMQVLKDASASAIYGSRAANGVILIETKTGSKGPIRLSAEIDYGVQQLAKKLDLLNAEEWRTVNTDARAAAGLAPADFLTDYLGELQTEGTDYQDEMYVTAPVAKYNLSASGGSDYVNYNVSLGYLDQDGIVQTTKYTQLNLQVKTDYTKGKLSFGESLLVSKEFRKNTPQDGGGRGNVVESAVMANPNIKIYKADYTEEQLAMATTPVGSGGNVIGILNLDTDQNEWYRIFLSTYGQYEIIPGLKYKLSIGTNDQFNNYEFGRPIYALQDVYAMGTQMRAQDGELTESNTQNTYWLVENTLNYVKEFGLHNLNLLLGQSAEKFESRNAGGTVYNLPNGVQVLGAGSRTPSVSGSASANSIDSYFGRVIYSYNSKYILSATLRRDGSSRFSPENKYGLFPSYAVAWNASNEDFLKSNPIFSLLKLRASYGTLGNQDIGDYQYLGLIQPAYTMTIGSGSSLWTGATQVNYPAVGIKWESTATSNVGLDLGMWKGKLNFTFDYFDKTTTDLLLRIPIPYSVGAGSDPYGNAGKIRNKGFETLLTYNGKIKDFNFSVSGTFSRIRNEVVELSTASQQLSGAVASLHGGSPVTYTKPGYPIYSFFVIKTDGLFRTQEEVDAHSKDGELIQKNAAPGDIRFVDYNDDGIIDGNDRQYCGSAFPDFEYGIKLDANWKMFDLSVLFQGTHGNMIYNAFKTYIESVRAENNYSTKVLDSFTYNPNGSFPRLIITDPNGNGIDNSDQFLEDGSYFRLKTITLGFNFPDKWVNTLSIVNARIYVGAQNLFTTTKYEGYNPDIGGGGWQGTGLGTRGVDYSNYPLAKAYHVGLQFNF